MADRTRVTVKMRPTDIIAEEIFAPGGVMASRAWGNTRTVAARARRNAPVRTGKLRRSIQARKAADSTRARPVYEVYSPLKYAAPQETGFRHWRSGRFVPGFHYMRDALRSVRW